MLNDDKHRIIAAIFRQLIAHARLEGNRTYGHIGDHVGLPAIAVPQYLDTIGVYCQMRNLPPLPVIAVSQATGRPGQGYTGRIDNLEEQQDRVRCYNWDTVNPDAIRDLMAN